MRHKPGVTGGLCLLLLGCASGRSAGPAAAGLAIVGVTVIDPSSSRPPALNQTILVSGGIIRAVGSSAAMPIPSGARRIDARGKYAIPGLWDAHVHFMNTGVTALSLYVAHGVTSVREMGGYLDSGLTDLEHGMFPPTISTMTPPARDSLYRTFVEKKAWYTPTLSISRTVMLAGDSAALAIFGPDAIRVDERRAYASAWLLEWWRMQVDERIRDPQPLSASVMESAYQSSIGDVRRMHELGVEILAGSDAGSVLVYPGFALHEELRLLVEDAKLTSRDALRSATIGPARFARLDDRLGTLAAGKIADIVLLDADPLADIRNTRRIAAVIQGGRYFARSDLDALLSAVRSAVAVPTP